MLTLSIDAMGGDLGPRIVVSAIKKAVKRYPHYHFLLVGDQSTLSNLLIEYKLKHHSCITVHHAPNTISMTDSPLSALRHSKNTSMRLALDLVRQGKANACLSCGNTGALVAMSKNILGMFHGLERPALIKEIPTKNKNYTYILDLGANNICDAENLYQFALLGSAYVKSIRNIAQPRIALFNIGKEKFKGNRTIQETAYLLEQENKANLNYIGFIEGDELFNTMANVIVCEGIIGNSILKSVEGLSSLMRYEIFKIFNQNIATRLAYKIIKKPLMQLIKKYNPIDYNGAILLGLNHIVIKSHGNANEFAFYQAIKCAMLSIEGDILLNVQKYIDLT